MATKKEAVKKVEVVKEVKKPVMSYVLTFSDGTVIEGSTNLRTFQPNIAKGFQNSGFQVKVSDGDYSGNIMIIDSMKQIRL
jgi:hypothetical protein